MGRYLVAASVALTALLAVACSDDHSTPITPAATKTALSQMRAIPAPAGFVRGSDPCAEGYVCFHSATGPAMTAADYRRLSNEFGVKLTDAQCDRMLTAANGRATQNCTASGRYGRWGVAALLTVKRTDASHGETDLGYAPARDFG